MLGFLSGFVSNDIAVIATFTLALSGWTDNDWTGSAKFGLLTRSLSVGGDELMRTYEAIRETQVQFAPFDVDYGQFTGCAINVVTKGGTNRFSGETFS